MHGCSSGSFGRRLRRALLMASMPWQLAGAQLVGVRDHHVRIDGDTTSLPHSCRPSDAVQSIENWWLAVSSGDARLIAKSVSPRFWWISVSPFNKLERLFTTHRWVDLEPYIKRRARAHERLILRAVRFTGWRRGALNFGPIYFERRADDLGRKPLEGIGKGAFACSQGLVTLSIAPSLAPTDPKARR